MLPDTGHTPVTIRAAGLSDLPAINAIYNHYVLHTAVTFDLEPFDPFGRRAWFDDHAATGPHRLLVAAADDGRLVGYASSSRWRPKPAYLTTVETSVYCHADEKGRGYGRALYALLFDMLTREDVHRAVAGVCLPNAASVALHERFGFTPIGIFTEVGRKFGTYHDVAWFERRVTPEPHARATKD